MSKADRWRRLAETRPDETLSNNKSEVIDKIVGMDNEGPEQKLNNNSVTEQSNVTLPSNSNTVQSSASLNRNSTTEQSNVTVVHNSDYEQLYVSERVETPSATRVPRPIEEFEKRLKRPTIEETHTRQTWLINNDLLRRLNKLARNQERGFKTHLINYALERILNELEGK